MYLLDTNHCSAIILNNQSVINQLESLGSSLVSTCAIVQGELVDMAEPSRRKEDNLALVYRFLQGIYVYEIDEITADRYGQIKAALFNQFAPKEKSKQRKTKITDLGFDENDIWITAVALQNNLTIVSDDSDFQRIKQVKTLSVESWF